MMRIIDTFSLIEPLFDNGIFNIEKWELYIDSIYDRSASIFKNDLIDCLKNGDHTYEKDVLPILNAVFDNPQLETLHSSFRRVTDGLNKKILDRFGRDLNVDIVLYMGLCNAAGWVTAINGRDVILLGIEKILELNWCDDSSMYGLVYHELGHIYHKQYGMLNQRSDNNARNFVWQLFTEGIAMYFEQALVNDFNYYHQNKNGWLEWCDDHYEQISADFHSDLPTMTKSNQRYFGDWVSYCGKGDVGYYLGAKFVRQLRDRYSIEQLINMNIDDIYQEYLIFTESK
ncbi:MAG: M1 family metallopeptidase [Ruminococcaceae bacterium]|nr:M1 family metallopeptidase [Oscillospiraceae bacterium]